MDICSAVLIGKGRFVSVSESLGCAATIQRLSGACMCQANLLEEPQHLLRASAGYAWGDECFLYLSSQHCSCHCGNQPVYRAQQQLSASARLCLSDLRTVFFSAKCAASSAVYKAQHLPSVQQGFGVESVFDHHMCGTAHGLLGPFSGHHMNYQLLQGYASVR